MPLPDLRVAADRRTLATDDGRPFFYLGDTAWELFHRLTREDADRYLRDRAAKGFTVIQAVALAEYGGLTEPNPYGALPLAGDDPARPQEAYFQHVDWVVRRAAELGLRVGLLPTWGDKWNRRWGQGPEVFTPAGAAAYGEWLGRRYRDDPVIWVLGGDRVPERAEHVATIRAMAHGIRRGDGGRHLMTFHPMGQHSSGQYFHAEPWLDFNMLQSGHTRDRDSYHAIGVDYARLPAKPCLDGEPGYEDHPHAFKAENGYLDADDVRKFAYWAVLSGACGHTYGCHDIWQFFDAGREPITAARTPWRQALDLPGAAQMGHVRRLVEPRLGRGAAPDQAIVLSDHGEAGAHVAALRAADGAFALAYVPDGRPVTLGLGWLEGRPARAAWHDPRTGAAAEVAGAIAGPAHTFTPPSSGRGQDWALIIERQ